MPSAPTREYIYSGGARRGGLAKIESGAVQYYHADQLSVRLMTDSAGNVIGQQAHYPFGQSWYQTNTTTKWLFTSYERDAESGNDYAMARYNVNRLGRFASPDLLAGSASNPQSLDRYAYVRDDPVNLVDPLGLACGWWDMVTGGTPDCEDGGGYTVDGVPVDAQMAGWLLRTGAGAVCGSDCGAEAVSTRYCTSAGNCTPFQTVIITPDMRIWVPASTVSWNDSATGASGSSSEPGYWTTVGQLQADPFGGTTPAESGGAPNNSATLDARAAALAKALNKTGIQSLANPCTVGAFYGASGVLGAGGGAAAGGEVAQVGASLYQASAPYWPTATTWLYQQAQRGFLVVNTLSRIYGTISGAAQAACDSLQ